MCVGGGGGGGGVCSRVIHEYAAQTIQIFKFSGGGS